ncbi:MAG: carboxypeptidase regulatory-like domain-containing protein [Acidobacteria bacterium]|nr:carboxypeptidase regulatory-like domain-containing protein [Acidobacteriota bacterium]
MKNRFAILIVLITLFLSALTGFAQLSTATLSGIVVDEKEAVVPNATITAVNEATRLTRKVTTNNDGYFTIPLLPPGNYTLTVEREGFSIARVSKVLLNVGDQRTFQIQMKVGQVGETVEVVGDSGIEESAAVGTVVDRQFVANLPLNGRSFRHSLRSRQGGADEGVRQFPRSIQRQWPAR